VDYFKIEAAAKAAFSDQYPCDYLQRLEARKANRDIAELLWVAFAHGYAGGMSDAAKVCDQIAGSAASSGVVKLTAKQCAAAIRKS
jgi:hypothetical protein